MSLTIQLDPPADITVSIANGYMVVLRSDGTSVFLSDFRDKAAGVADLIARMFEALASAPDLTPEERMAVRDRMMEAQVSVRHDEPIPYAPKCLKPTGGAGHGLCGLDAGHTGECYRPHVFCGTVHPYDYCPDDTPAHGVKADLPPPADATARELSYFDAEADAIDVPPLCFAKIPGGMCVLDRGHGEPCTNEREWRVSA